MRYSVQLRDQIFVKGYGFLPFAKNMGRNIGKNISKNVSGRCGQKLLDHPKQFSTNATKTASKRAIQKAAQIASDLIGNKIADRITRVSKTSPKNNLEVNEQEIHREKYISSEARHKIINGLRVKEEN